MTSPSSASCALTAFLAFAAFGCGSGDEADASHSTSGTITGAGGNGSGSHHGSGGSSGGSGPGSGGSGTNSGSGGFPGALCGHVPACDTPPPDPGPEQDWNHDFLTPPIAALGDNHRGRDLFLNPGDDQWIIAKFAYGSPLDKDIHDENVDIYLLRDCGTTWEYLDTAVTSEDDEHATVEGVPDSGGRIYYRIPDDKKLGLGRHRVHLVVQGDLTTTDLFIEVVPEGAPLFVSDVDGTLTGSENAEFGALLTGALPDMNPGASEALRKLAAKGYHPSYVTARPEYLTGRTRKFLDVHEFPPGPVHTSQSLTGELGSAATDYKTGELALLATKSLVPAWAFGNTATDAEAYDNGGISPLKQRIFFQFSDGVYGGRRIESYKDLFDEIDALPDLCR